VSRHYERTALTGDLGGLATRRAVVAVVASLVWISDVDRVIRIASRGLDMSSR
jgi:hypothetical protein